MKPVSFCEGCNEKYELDGVAVVCPHCGVELIRLDTATTALVEDLELRETHGAGTGAFDGSDSLVGSELGGYAIRSFVGRGGMARVYRAEHKILERPCALKVLHGRAEKGLPAPALGPFLNEARAAAALVHPHVVTVHNIGFDRGYHFIEMEFVEGRSLQETVDRGGPLAPLRATDIMVSVTSALSCAHSKGMVHRDLKPANVLLDADGTPKLADFGLAKRVVGDELRESGNLVGTPYFMAPELFGGASASPRSDVYAAGVSFFFLLTGRFPFLARSVNDLARKHKEEPPPSVSALAPGVAPRLQSLVERCLAKDAWARYGGAAELCDALREAYAGLRDLDSLITDALDGLGATWTGEGDSFEVCVALPNGRTQRVFINAAAGGATEPLVRIYSVAAPVAERYLRRALELNATLPHAAVALAEIDGAPHFVLTQSYPRATCDPEEVRESVLSVARWSDMVEALLTGEDRF